MQFSLFSFLSMLLVYSRAAQQKEDPCNVTHLHPHLLLSLLFCFFLCPHSFIFLSSSQLPFLIPPPFLILLSSFSSTLIHPHPHSQYIMSTDSDKPHVLIVGGGLGGLMLGALLEKAAMPYIIFERAITVKPLGTPPFSLTPSLPAGPLLARLF